MAAVLLFAGGLQSLQTATIASALPFAMVMLLMCHGLLKALRREALRESILQAQPASAATIGSWQRQLHSILHNPSRAEVLSYLSSTAIPALEAVSNELRQRGVATEVQQDEDRIRLLAMTGSPEEFRYGIRARGYALPSFAFIERGTQPTGRERYYRAEVFLREGGQNYDVMGYGRNELIADVLAQYERHLAYLHAADRGA